jgi:DNA-directed RNA polymerase subunit M/transcription elongation factor TFIIS
MKNKQKKELCPKCGSKNIISHTDKKLRQNHKLVMQCFECNNFWKVSY